MQCEQQGEWNTGGSAAAEATVVAAEKDKNTYTQEICSKYNKQDLEEGNRQGGEAEHKIHSGISGSTVLLG